MTIRAGGLVDVADFGTDDSVSVSVSGGMASGDVQAWLQGGMAGIEFVAAIGTATHNTVIGTFPDGYRPPWRVTVDLVPNSTNPPVAFIWIETNGEMRFLTYGTAGSSGTTLRGGRSWPRSV